MTRAAAPQTKFLFERSFDDPRAVYLPGEKFGPPIQSKAKKKRAPANEDQADGEAAETAAPEPKPEPEEKFTQAQLDAAREEGYIEGHTAALEEAETAREHYMSDALGVIAKNLESLEDQQKEANKDLGKAAMRIVYAVVEKVLPEAAHEHAVMSVEALIRDVIPLVMTEPKLVVRTHNMIAEPLEDRLDDLMKSTSFQGSVSVVPDYELQPGDCRVEWDGGGADRDEGRLWREIREIISDNIGPVDVEALDKAADSVEAMTDAPEEPESTDAVNTTGETNPEDLGPSAE